MLLASLLLVVGLALLLVGGETIVRGATGLARDLHVSPLVIGLTVIAFGTSAPELAVNLTAALQDRASICFGNIIGSNMANIGLVVGCAAGLRPILIERVLIAREIPMMLLATTAAVVMSLDRVLGTGPDVFDRGEGVMLLMLFALFLRYTIGDFVAQRNEAKALEDLAPRVPPGLLRHLGLTALGLAVLLGGARVAVDAAVVVARDLGISEVVIGLTILAIGTSLPELVASVVATLRRQVGLAVGNVVGSNIFNLLLVGGITATVRPIPVPEYGHADLAVVSVLSLVLWRVSATHSQHIIRTEAAFLMLVYLGYLIWRTFFLV